MPHFAVAFVAVFCAGVVQGVTGFAFGILAVAVLTMLWGVREASVVVSFLACWNVAHTLWSVRQGVRWRIVGLIGAGVLIGQPIGARALVTDSLQVFLLYLLAAACLAVALQELCGGAPADDATGPGSAAAVLAGVVSGFMTTTVTSGGPPVIWYVYRHPFTREQLKATTLAVFAFGLALKFIVWGWQDLTADGVEILLTGRRALWALYLLPATVLGSATGIWLFRRVDAVRLRRLVCYLLLLLAAMVANAATRAWLGA